MDGVDTVAYSFPVASPDRGEGATALVEFGPTRDHLTSIKTLRKLPSGGTLRSGVGGYAAVEVSAPKYALGSNVVALPWVQAVDVIREVYEEAVEHVEPLLSFEDGRFVRVDVVRDFDGVHGWPVLAPALERVAYMPRTTSRVFSDHKRNGSLSLGLGNTQYRAILYDKHRESMGAAPAGRVRYELRHGKAWCRKLGVSLTSDGRLATRTQEVFTVSRLAASVGGMFEVLQAVLDSSDLSTSERLRVLGYLYAESQGVRLRASKATEAKYRRIVRGLGLAVGEVPAGEVSARLDYESGRLVTEVAA